MQGRENSGIKDATSLQDMGKVGCMEEPLENNLGDTNFSHSATRNKKSQTVQTFLKGAKLRCLSGIMYKRYGKQEVHSLSPLHIQLSRSIIHDSSGWNACPHGQHFKG